LVLFFPFHFFQTFFFQKKMIFWLVTVGLGLSAAWAGGGLTGGFDGDNLGPAAL
jgi:hypothetical protein